MKILADIRAAVEGDEAASWATKLQNTASAGATICKKPQDSCDLMPVIVRPMREQAQAHGPWHFITNYQ